MFDSTFVGLGIIGKAKALDDRVGCAILLELLKENYDIDLIACFTVQEEIGLRGAQVAAGMWAGYGSSGGRHNLCRYSGCAGHMHTTRMGRALPYLYGPHFIVHPELFKQMVETAEKHSIPYQIKENVGRQ